MQQDRWILVGATRGLGQAFRGLVNQNGDVAFGFSRKETDPAHQFDAAQEDAWPAAVRRMQAPSVTRLVYFAGGGPYGFYQDKKWSDHQWAWRVSFLFPAFLLHHILSHPQEWESLRQICFIGSSIAESKPDPKAASYASAKHSLKGLISSVTAELREQNSTLDLRLFSPGYMDTGLLPTQAWPRQVSGQVRNPQEIAEKLWQWLHVAGESNEIVSYP